MDRSIYRTSVLKEENGILEVEGLPRGEYDHQATKYDRLISKKIYNQLMWGNSPSDYADFLRENLVNRQKGMAVDIGCGTLSFTARVYGDFDSPDIILSDYSIEMLKIGKKRLEDFLNNESTISFLRADALDMPFTDSSIQTIFSFGVLHIFQNPSTFLKGCHRILKSGGLIHLTSLCTDRKISHSYLNFLQKKGHVATPLSSQKINTLVEKAGFNIINQRVKGGMAYISAKKDI